jgi:hypothetical protein
MRKPASFCFFNKDLLSKRIDMNSGGEWQTFGPLRRVKDWD